MTFADALNRISLPLSIKLLVITALWWFTPHAATSQGPTYPDPIPIYGFDVDEFIIGAWITKWALPDTADELSPLPV